MYEIVSALKATYKKQEREKMAVILALWFLASRKLPLCIEIV